MEHNKRVNEYRNSKVVQVVKKLLAQSSGEVTVSAEEIIQASQWIGGGVLTIHDSPQKVGRDLLGYVELFREVDGIDAQNRKGAHGKRSWSYKTHATHATNVTHTQQSLDL